MGSSFFFSVWIISFVNRNTKHLAKNHFVKIILSLLLTNNLNLNLSNSLTHYPLALQQNSHFHHILIC